MGKNLPGQSPDSPGPPEIARQWSQKFCKLAQGTPKRPLSTFLTILERFEKKKFFDFFALFLSASDRQSDPDFGSRIQEKCFRCSRLDPIFAGLLQNVF